MALRSGSRPRREPVAQRLAVEQLRHRIRDAVLRGRRRGWRGCSDATARRPRAPSCSNRDTAAGSAARRSGRILTATSRSSRVSRATVDLAHSAAAEAGQDLVGTETGAGGQGHRRRKSYTAQLLRRARRGRNLGKMTRMATITLRVNGKTHTVDVEPSTPLLYVLRNDLDLSGPRFGCGLGQCGACTVLIKGEAVRSCVRPVSQVPERRDHHARGPVEGRQAPSAAAGVDRRAGAAVRLLPERADPHRQGAARQDAESHRRADSRRHEGHVVPLHDLLPDQRRH